MIGNLFVLHFALRFPVPHYVSITIIVMSLTCTGQILKTVLIRTAEFNTDWPYSMQGIALITGQGKVDAEVHTS